MAASFLQAIHAPNSRRGNAGVSTLDCGYIERGTPVAGMALKFSI